MNTKNDVEVVIGGKQYTLSGYESSDYLQKVAVHINDKIQEFKQQEGYSRLDNEMKHILLAINLADDYYKTQKTADDLQERVTDLEKEIFDMKHDMIAMKTQLEEREKHIEELELVKTDAEHKAIRLEAEIEGMKSEEESEPEAVAESDANQNLNQSTSVNHNNNNSSYHRRKRR